MQYDMEYEHQEIYPLEECKTINNLCDRFDDIIDYMRQYYGLYYTDIVIDVFPCLTENHCEAIPQYIQKYYDVYLDYDDMYRTEMQSLFCTSFEPVQQKEIDLLTFLNNYFQTITQDRLVPWVGDDVIWTGDNAILAQKIDLVYKFLKNTLPNTKTMHYVVSQKCFSSLAKVYMLIIKVDIMTFGNYAFLIMYGTSE